MTARLAVIAWLCLSASPAFGQADGQLPSDVTFNLKRSYLEQLLTGGPDHQTVGARWTVNLNMGEHSKVHALAADCELHFGAKLPNNRKLGNPSGIVVEPPNVCKYRLPEISKAGAIGAAWLKYFDANVTSHTCEVSGFPRIFSEHAQSGSGGEGSNPDHVLEIHPAIAINCGADSLNFLKNLKYIPGMRAISPASATACLEDRKLYVRQRGGTAADPRYEFSEEGAMGGAGRCGNFVIVEARITKEYLRRLGNSGDHTALARVWVGQSGPYPLKIYTYAGTPADDKIAGLMENPDEDAAVEVKLHGLITYDYFTIIRSLQKPASDSAYEWLAKDDLKDWKEVQHPLSLVVFGVVSDQ